MQEPKTPEVMSGSLKRKGDRSRQSFSCAECRRLKLKCSREWPCTSCQKRGCAQICPDGEMRTVRGRRLVLGETEDLHQRILNLETALAESHAHQSSEPHPLLTKTYHSAPPRRLPGSLDSAEGEQVVEQAFGTLTIGLGGEARFVGSLAGTEYLHDEEEGAEDGTLSPQRVPHVSGLATPPPTAVFPLPNGQPDVHFELLGLGGTANDIGQLRGLLPNWEDEGRGLVEAYWENVNWMYQIIPRPMFDNDHLALAYDMTVPPHAHKVACVFLVMALGVLFDLNRQAYDSRGKELFKLGIRCIEAGGIKRPTPALVQVFHLCGTFLLNDNDSSGAETFWPILGTAIKVAQRLGLHRDGDTFGLSPYEITERRQVWWELVTHDRVQSLCFGRPCSASNKSTDTLHPEPDELIADTDQFHKQKYGLIRMLEQVIDLQTQPAPVPIQQVLAIDQRFQEFKVALPIDLLPDTPIEALPMDNTIHPHLILRRFGIRLLIAQSRLLLNRPAFARALKDRPTDPAVGSLGQSFVALYESALEIVQLVKALVVYHPSLVARWWHYWHHAATACVCLSAIVIQAPNCALASPAFHAMTSIVDICKASKEGSRAKRILPTLLRLQARASEALRAAVKSGRRTGGDEIDSPDDDLHHLRGSAKLRRTISTPLSIESKPNDFMSGSSATPQPIGVVLASRQSPDDASPLSMGSMATSDTMVEATVNEFGGQIWNMPLRGAVPPPPPEVSMPSPVDVMPAQSGTARRLRPRESLKPPRRSTVPAPQQVLETETSASRPVAAESTNSTDPQGPVWQPLLSRPVPPRPPTWLGQLSTGRPSNTHSRTYSYPPMPLHLPSVEEADESMAGPSTVPDLSDDAHAAYQYILSQAGQASYFAMPTPATSSSLVPSPAEMAARSAFSIGEPSPLVQMTSDPFNMPRSPDQVEEEDFDFDMFVHHMPDGYNVVTE